jgi:RNA polymerase sigma-70 factor (sigma-E family)
MAPEDEFERFVRAASARLLRAAWLLVGDWPAAEDLVQAAFERTWPRWTKLSDDAHRLAYLHRVVMHLFLRGRRRKWTGELASEHLPQRTGIDEIQTADLRVGLVSALRRLPPRQRAVIALRYVADLTEAQTATAMNCSTGTVKSYSARALAALRSDPSLTDLLTEDIRP